MKRRKLVFVLIALVCLGAFGFDAAYARTGLDKEQKFVYSSRSEITGMNPLINTTAPPDNGGVQSIILEAWLRGLPTKEAMRS